MKYGSKILVFYESVKMDLHRQISIGIKLILICPLEIWIILFYYFVIISIEITLILKYEMRYFEKKKTTTIVFYNENY